MIVRPTRLPGVLIIEPDVFQDARGAFLESFQAQRYAIEAGIIQPFVQDNMSWSSRGVLRGLHFQRRQPQGKLIQVLAGSVYDVAADVNPGSPTFGQYVAVELSASAHRQIWIPPAYAHGFCVTSEQALLSYKCTQYYDPDDEDGVAWNCPRLNIDWPVSAPILSAKDQRLPGL